MTIQELYKSALEAERETGIPALFSVAQAILESGWHITPIKDSNNVFGIKYHKPEWGYVNGITVEYINGNKRKVVAQFQKYPTLADCFADHNYLLTLDIRGKYANYSYKECLEHYKKYHDLEEYVQCVAKSYATDPHYAEKILNIIKEVREKLEPDDEETKQAKELMKEAGVFKPYGAEGVYWGTHPTRLELAIILYRLINKLKITLKEGE
jgi:flagellar protein FlgJ